MYRTNILKLDKHSLNRKNRSCCTMKECNLGLEAVAAKTEIVCRDCKSLLLLWCNLATLFYVQGNCKELEILAPKSWALPIYMKVLKMNSLVFCVNNIYRPWVPNFNNHNYSAFLVNLLTHLCTSNLQSTYNCQFHFLI